METNNLKKAISYSQKFRHDGSLCEEPKDIFPKFAGDPSISYKMYTQCDIILERIGNCLEEVSFYKNKENKNEINFYKDVSETCKNISIALNNLNQILDS